MSNQTHNPLNLREGSWTEIPASNDKLERIVAVFEAAGADGSHALTNLRPPTSEWVVGWFPGEGVRVTIDGNRSMRGLTNMVPPKRFYMAYEEMECLHVNSAAECAEIASSEPDIPAGYEDLADVLQRAFDQASKGKGKDRHAQDLPFADQPMQNLISLYGPGFALGQAAKKAQESQRLPAGQDVHELLGAIVYLAGAVIYIENNREDEQ